MLNGKFSHRKYGLLFSKAWQYFPVDSFLLNLALFSCDCMQEGDGSRDCDLHVDDILFAPGLMCVYAIACMCVCVCVCVQEGEGWVEAGAVCGVLKMHSS